MRNKKLFEELDYIKQNIAKGFSSLYFEDETDMYWVGEDLLAIGDHYIAIQDIRFAFENGVTSEELFKFLKKPHRFSLEDFLLGKVGRKEKRKAELEKCKESVNAAWLLLKQSIDEAS